MLWFADIYRWCFFQPSFPDIDFFFYLLYHCIDSEKSKEEQEKSWFPHQIYRGVLAATGSLPEDEAKAKLGDTTTARFGLMGGPVDLEFFVQPPKNDRKAERKVPPGKLT